MSAQVVEDSDEPEPRGATGSPRTRCRRRVRRRCSARPSCTPPPPLAAARTGSTKNCPRTGARVGLRQVSGMPCEPRCRSAEHPERIARERPSPRETHEQEHAGQPARDDTSRQETRACIRVRDEEVNVLTGRAGPPRSGACWAGRRADLVIGYVARTRHFGASADTRSRAATSYTLSGRGSSWRCFSWMKPLPA